VHRLAFVDLLAGKSTEQPALEGRPSDQIDREQAAGEQVAAELSGADFPGPVEPEQAVDTFRSSESLRIELVAAEPLVTDPVAFDWGPDGRLWVAEMRDYPVADGADHARRGRVRVLLDDDQDGRYDRAEPFLEGLFYPTGVMAWHNGVLISGAPHLIYAEDTDGDLRADVQRVVVQGFGEGNQQHRVNGLRWGVDGWVYLANGDSGGSISLPAGDRTWNLGGRDLRIQPDAGKLELLSGQTQFIRCRDDLGNWFGGNNSDPLWHYLLEDRYLARNPAYAAPSVRRQVPERPGPAPVFPASKTLPRFNDFDRADRFTSACGPLVVYHYQGTAASSIDFGPAGSMDSYVCEPVHNLVHRERMEVEGLSFRSRRLPQDEAAEFLASTDSWFRPVMIRSGPDGALWVADMYRLVIEHPEWIPQHWQQQLDLNAGHDRGRIYRITPRASEPLTALPRLNDLSDQELVERLASPIRWQRDMAHQMIVWRNARQVVPALREMAEQAQWPVSRIQALYAIAALDGIEAPWLAQLIQSAPPEVACHAVALSEPHLSQPGPLLESVLTRGAASDDLPLRRQIACSLGFATDPRAAKCLAELALGSPIEPIVQAAVFSSLTEQNVREVMMHARNLEVAVAADKRAFMRQLLTQAVVLGDRATQELVLASLLEPADADATTWRIETLADVLMRYERKHGGTQSLPDTIQQGIQQMMQSAQSVSVDRTAASTLRLAAVELLGRAEASAEVLRTLGELLDPRQPPELQTEAARTLLQVSEQEAMPLILAQWPGYSPRMRNRILDQVMGRAELTQAMLHEASQRQLDLQLDARRRQQLLAARDPKIAEAAKTLLQSGTAEDRSALIARYLPAHELSGDVTRGRQVFQRACSTCHQLDGLGHAVGPDLAALSNKSVEFLVASILDPNQAVESSYLDYLVETVDGRQLTGLLQAETGSGVTLLAADGKEQRVPREEIEMMQTTGKSLMPEGLEKDMSPADMHDLLIYLRSHQPQRKLFAGNQPQDAPRRDDGSIRLLAMHAEIFGPSLVFEPQYRNLGFWSSPQDYAAWTVEVPAAGIYEVVLEYACPDDAAGNRFVLSCRDQFVSGEIRGTGTWDNYAWRDVGMIELPAGRSRIVLRADGPLSSYLLDLHQIILYPQ
jgi:putative membrane-bound dehydrogenase-like protein